MSRPYFAIRGVKYFIRKLKHLIPRSYLAQWLDQRRQARAAIQVQSTRQLCLGFSKVKAEEMRALTRRNRSFSSPLSALCLSGGGIRSAAFSLGAIQALASERLAGEEDRVLIEDVDYLSTVSGGGFMGGWLTAWLHRVGFPSVRRGLVDRDAGHEAEPLKWLRANTNYLTPKLGFLSGNTIGAITLSMRNLLLNWAIWIPALSALIISIKLIGVVSNWIIFWGNAPENIHKALAFSKGSIEVGLFVVSLVKLRSALSFELRHRPSLQRKGPSRWVLAKKSLIPSVIAAFCLAHFLCCDLTGRLLLQCADAQGEQRDTDTLCQSKIYRKPIGKQTLAGRPLPSTPPTYPLPKASLLDDPPAAPVRLNELRFSPAMYILAGMLAGSMLYLWSWLSLPKDAQRRTKNEILVRTGHWLKRLRRRQGSITNRVTGTGNDSVSEAARLFVTWWASGAAYGALVSLGLMLYLKMPDEGFRASATGLKVPIFYLQIVFMIPWLILCQVITQMLFVGLASHALNDTEREFYAYLSGRLLLCGVGWLALTLFIFLWDILGIYVGVYVSYIRILRDYAPIIATASGLLSAFLARRGAKAEESRRPLTSRAINSLFVLSAVIFVATLISLMSSLIDHVVFRSTLQQFIRENQNNAIEQVVGHAGLDMLQLSIALAACILLTLAADGAVNTNFFSLHAVYRDRLIRAYLGASNLARRPNQVLDMDAKDNLMMASLRKPRGQLTWLPFHVLNASLNLLEGKNLAWQERKAMSFTMSPLHCGCQPLGYRRSSKYTPRGISLGTAMAISGAAASPSMGAYSSSGKTFFMTLLNLRLGVWLGNPGEPGERGGAYQKAGPTYALKPLIWEAFGLTSERDSYVHLSDGGHFDNLGLYEMVARGCRSIICIDASCDPNFQFWELSNAARKIQIDFGVEIKFYGLNNIKKTPNEAVKEFVASDYYMVGEIGYSEAPIGLILYIKPICHGNEGIGIKGYKEKHADFPHEGTSNQWFSEPQFESYRMLSFTVAQKILEDGRSTSSDGQASLRRYLENLLVKAKRATPPTVIN